MKSSDVTLWGEFWDIVKHHYRRTHIFQFTCQIGFISAIILFFVYSLVSGYFFSQWVDEQTEDLVRNPTIAGVTTMIRDESPLSVLYVFKSRQAMFNGILISCEKYVALGWEHKSKRNCKEEVSQQLTKKIEALGGEDHTFCMTDDLRISIYYSSADIHLREKYPWSFRVHVLGRRSGIVC